MPRATPTLRQRKIFALTRILGGLVAACYLAYVVVANLAAGQPFDTTLKFTALVAIAGFAYAAWYLRDLSAVAREERARDGANGER
jgi:archaellum biogenesis protein FlaJ (TadC family)